MGNAYVSLGEYQKAIEYYEKSLQISTEKGDRSGIASKNCNLGNAYQRLGEYHKAIEYYEKGLKISTEIEDRSAIASSNGNLGIAYGSLGEYQKAIEYYEIGLQISIEIGDRSRGGFRGSQISHTTNVKFSHFPNFHKHLHNTQLVVIWYQH